MRRKVAVVDLPSCFMFGLKSTLVTVSLWPLKCLSSVGSSYEVIVTQLRRIGWYFSCNQSLATMIITTLLHPSELSTISLANPACNLPNSMPSPQWRFHKHLFRTICSKKLQTLYQCCFRLSQLSKMAAVVHILMTWDRWLNMKISHSSSGFSNVTKFPTWHTSCVWATLSTLGLLALVWQHRAA